MSDFAGMTGITDANRLLDQAAQELSTRFNGVYSRESVRQLIDDSYGLLVEQSSITAYLPTLAVRFATERLAATARHEGHLMATAPEVLFVCVHNAGRSQMAAALLDSYAQGRIHVRSAGSAPASEINPAVVAVMDELGLDLSHEFPKPLTTDVVQGADVVITMGCGDACPIFPGKQYLDWQLDDPAGRSVDDVRPIRDEIRRRVEALADELMATHA